VAAIGTLVWLGSIVLGTLIGAGREQALFAFLVCAFLGPFGVLLCLVTDDRPQCPLCLGRLDGRPLVCRHCRTRLQWEGPIPSGWDEIAAAWIGPVSRPKARYARFSGAPRPEYPPELPVAGEPVVKRPPPLR